MSTPAAAAGAPRYPIRSLWMQYEKIAMHFNDLLIKIRVQSLGGLAAIGTIAAYFIKGVPGSATHFGYMAFLILLLLLTWIAVAVLDLRYYEKMLIGAVRAIHELEEASKLGTEIDHISLSTRMTEAVEQQLTVLHPSPVASWFSGGRLYYLSVGIILFLTFAVFFVLAIW